MAAFLPIALLAFTGCTAASATQPSTTQAGHNSLAELAPLVLPELQPAALNGDKLRVVATTSIIGDVVGQVGGDAIDLTVLMGPSQDPHGYEPSAGDLRSAAEADVIFVNGWDLEEGLVEDLRNVSPGIPLIPVSAGIPPLPIGEHEEKAATQPAAEQQVERADSHTWLDPGNVILWVDNIEQVLVALDVGNDIVYTKNSADYATELQELVAYYDEKIDSIPAGRRKLVTNHDTLAYFAERYDFDIVGVVMPGGSTLAEPSAGDLAQLTEELGRESVCAIFVETTTSEELANTVAAELDGCASVRVVSLYTGALGPRDSPAGTYIGMMRANIDAIVRALQ